MLKKLFRETDTYTEIEKIQIVSIHNITHMYND